MLAAAGGMQMVPAGGMQMVPAGAMQMVPAGGMQTMVPVGPSNKFNAQMVMVYPGMGAGGCHHQHKCNCKKRKKKKKKKKSRSDSESESDTESEYYYVRRNSALAKHFEEIEREEVDRYGSMPQVMYRVGDHNGAPYAPSPNVTSLPQRAGGANGAGNKPRPSSAPGAGGRNGGGGGFGGGRKYEIFTPSHPQAVNQYVDDYTYGPAPQPQSQNGYKQDLQRYKESLAQYQADRLEEKYLSSMENYDLAMDGGYPDEDVYLDDYDPYMYDGGGGYDDGGYY